MSSTYEKILNFKKRLSKSPASLEELAVYMNCDKRTVYRYLRTVEDEGLLGKKANRFYLEAEENKTLNKLIRSLEKMNEELAPSAETARYGKVIKSTIKFLKDDVMQEFPEDPLLSSHFVIDRGPFAEFDLNQMETRIEKYQDAIKNRKCLKIRYEHRLENSKISEMVIKPLELILRIDTLYLVYRERSSVSDAPVKLLVFKNIKQETTLNETFEEIVFDSEPFYKYCFGKWVPENKPEPQKIILNVISPWLKSQFRKSNFNPKAKTKNLSSGDMQVELNLYRTPDLESWLFSLYPDAFVVEPTSLKKAIKDRLKQSMKLIK